MPPKEPDITGYDFAAVIEPAKEIAGDLYDYIALSRQKHVIVVADVADKGVAAGMWGTAFAGYLRGLLCERSFDRPEEFAHVISLLNKEMCRSGGMKFATALVMMLDCDRHTLDIVNAGHQWPVYFSAARDQVEPLTDAHTSMIIGVRDCEEYQAVRVSLDSGDLLVCFTDGVDEASNKPAHESGKPYGRHRVEAVVSQAGRQALSAQDILRAIHCDLEKYRAQQLDDACILCIGRRTEKCA